MRKFLLILFISVNIKMSAQELVFSSENYAIFTMTDMSKKINYSKSKDIAFIYPINTEDSLMIVGGIYEEGDISYFKSASLLCFLENEYFFNAAKMYWEPYWGNDTIYVRSEMPFRATQWLIRFVYDYENKKFNVIDPEYYDPSWEAKELGDSLLKQGDIRGAINQYYGVMYPMNYMNEGEVGISIMEKAHENALRYFENKFYDSAVVQMKLALDYYPNSNYLDLKTKEDADNHFSDSTSWHEQWNLEQLKLWLGDQGLFLYKAKLYQESIELNRYLNVILPNVAGPYLQLADSYFDSGNKSKAKEVYKKYAELKKKQGKEKEIPTRVKDRMK